MLSSTKIYSTIDDPMAVFNEILLLSPSLAASQTPSKSSESPKSPKAPKEEEEKKFQAEENGERQKTVCFRRLSALELHEQEEAHEFREAHHARKTLMEVLPSEKEEKSDTIAMKGHILSHPLHKDSEWRSQRQQKLSNSMSKEEGQLEPETSTPEESKYHEVFDKYMTIYREQEDSWRITEYGSHLSLQDVGFAFSEELRPGPSLGLHHVRENWERGVRTGWEELETGGLGKHEFITAEQDYPRLKELQDNTNLEPFDPDREYDDKIRVVCMSDTHSMCQMMTKQHNYVIPEGDILVISGDLTLLGEDCGILALCKWLDEECSHFKHKIVVAGNHDLSLDEGFFPRLEEYYGERNLEIFTTFVQKQKSKLVAISDAGAKYGSVEKQREALEEYLAGSYSKFNEELDDADGETADFFRAVFTDEEFAKINGEKGGEKVWTHNEGACNPEVAKLIRNRELRQIQCENCELNEETLHLFEG